MSGLDAAIRARLAEFGASMDATGSLWGAEEMRDTILAVLDLHHREPALGGCSRCDTMWPCRHVRTIADKLGVEVRGA